MTDKDNVSMATVQMKPDYAASEVYSTASEAPPAYKRQSNSVKIAKITAFTIIVSSFILGAFILASSYLQAKASCDQVQALDSVLEKELMLETLQQVNKELPRAEALLGKETGDDIDLQGLEKDEQPPSKKAESKQQQAATVAEEEANENDNSYSDSDESDGAQKYPGKVPLELDLSDLAAALLQNNKKSRMNCVVERKQAEEIVDSPAKTVSLPFGMNLTTDPKKARITGERISIYCEGGHENKEREDVREFGRNAHNSMNMNNREEDDDSEEDAEPIRAMFIPFQRVPIPFGQIPQQFPLTHMPQRMLPPPMRQQEPQLRQMQMQMPPPFQQIPMRPPMPPQVMQAPHPEPKMQHLMDTPQQTVRIHVQQIPFREIHVADDVPVQIPAQHQELPHFQIQRLPLGLALQRAGITVNDLRNIQRLAENRFTDALEHLAASDSADATESAENSSNSNEEEDTNDSQTSGEQQQQQEQRQRVQEQEMEQRPEARNMEQQAPPKRLILQQLPEQPRDTMTPPMPDQPQGMYGPSFGRSLVQPVRIPVPMMQAQADMSQDSSATSAETEGPHPHILYPRSV